MYVTSHAEARLRSRLGALADPVIAQLEAEPGEPGSVAIEVHRFAEPVGDRASSYGDRVVVIARDGEIATVMMRRSWDQPFTRRRLRVDRLRRLGR